jgi:hypothetical protein
VKGFIFKDILKASFTCSLTTEYTFTKTLVLMILANLCGTPRPSHWEISENSTYKYRVAPDMEMTVRMIMILLYGAGEELGRGLIPMRQIRNLLLSDFPIRGC